MDEIRETALPYRSGKCTYEDYAKLPEGAPYQLIGGELVLSPAPTLYHQLVSSRLFRMMGDFVLEHHLGLVLYSPLDVHLNDEETYQPDIVFMAKSKVRIRGKKKMEEAPDLVVEILSPSTAEFDLGVKFVNYEKYGVREYWIVDPDDSSVEILVATSGKLLLDQRVAGQGMAASKVLAGFTVDLQDLFSYPEDELAE